MVARVGPDDDGRALIQDLAAAGVAVADVVALDDVRTGIAFVLVAADGENSIVVAPGANGRLAADETSHTLRRLLAPPAVLVTQAEVPTATIVAAITTATELGCRAIVNLAPYRPLPDEVLARCDPLVVNESEAGDLLGLDVRGIESARIAVSQLATVTRSAIITLGSAGAVVGHDSRVEHVPAEPTVVVDSTGAGDAFTGAVAAALSRGADLSAAVQLGVQAGSYAVGRVGAQASYPRIADLGIGDGLSAAP
jgi:ribokinase